MKVQDPPSAPSTIQQIIDFERGRGTNDWAGPQGAADGWLILQDYQTKILPNLAATRAALVLALGKIG